jgi:hypothetical protein
MTLWHQVNETNGGKTAMQKLKIAIRRIKVWISGVTKAWPKTKLVISDHVVPFGPHRYRYIVYQQNHPWSLYKTIIVSPWFDDYDTLLFNLQKQYWNTLRQITPDQFTRQYRRASAQKWGKLRGMKRG